MIMNKFKLSLLATAMICAAGVSGVSMAHTAPGTLSATDASTASSIDVYHKSCFTWNVNQTQAPGESATAAKRFVARAYHRCSVLSSTCTPTSTTGSKLRVSIGSPNGNTPLAGAFSAAGSPVSGGGIVVDNTVIPFLWGDGTSAGAWAQVKDNLGADANGTYTVAVSHTTGAATNYLATFHCENVAVGAAPAPDSSVGIHTGTGVNAGANPNSWIDVPNNASTTGGDFNQYIDQ
jgi:hypothetical protein